MQRAYWSCSKGWQRKTVGCCRFHGVTWGLVNNLPVWLTDAYLMNFHLMLRGKYLKKKAREAKKEEEKNE